MRKAVAVTALTASLAGGAIAGATIFAPALSGAQTPSTTAPSTQDPGSAPAAPGNGQNREQWITDALKPLVDNGTINQSQADAVTQALKDARPAKGPGGEGRGGHGPGAGLDAAAKALGISADELHTALDGGKSIAAVAQEKGVDVNTVIAALVADATAHIDQEVASGEHTQAEGDQQKAGLTDRITRMVNGEKPAGGPHGGRGPRAGQNSQNGQQTTPTTTN